MPPREARLIKEDLERLLASLIERGIVDDQNFPLLRQVSREAYEITFEGAEHVAVGMGDDVDYDKMYHDLAGRRCFSAKLIDGGLLQLMYSFKGGHLTKHRLAYYPSPDLSPFREDPESYLHDALFLDIVSRRIVPFPLRFDFDESAARDVHHPRCHLTLGDAKGCRIPVSAPLTPRWFIEFVLRHFYQTPQLDLVSALPAHKHNFAATITANESKLIHVVVPQAAIT
jgi:hypothetical protein